MEFKKAMFQSNQIYQMKQESFLESKKSKQYILGYFWNNLSHYPSLLVKPNCQGANIFKTKFWAQKKSCLASCPENNNFSKCKWKVSKMATSLEVVEAGGDLNDTVEVQSSMSPGGLTKKRHRSSNLKWENCLFCKVPTYPNF